MIFSLGVVAVGIVLVFACTIAFGKTIEESAAISLAMGIYFFGLNLMFRTADKSISNQLVELSDKIDDEKTKREIADKERDDRIKNIERIVEQWDQEK